jgi:UDP-3-O-[3-hydroxymyristoyl] glucosamine N-acyltransferase
VGCSGHLKVNDGAMLTPQSGVHNDIPAGATYSGSPAVEHRQWMKNAAALNMLPELTKTVRRLETEIARLRGAGGAA